MDFGKPLVIGLGAAVGANLRYFLGLFVSKVVSHPLPLGTLIVNMVGSFLIGLVLGVSEARGWGHGWTLFMTVGLLGGFTTFSAFSGENLSLVQRGRVDLFVAYGMGSVLCGLLLAWLGWVTAPWLSR